MGNLLSYKGYHSRVEFSAEDQVLHGKIEGITDLVTFESESAELIENEFRTAVDDYLAYCEEVGKEPEKEYSGTFNIRISPYMHKQLALYALKNDTSINSSVDTAISELLEKSNIEEQFIESSGSISISPFISTQVSMNGTASSYHGGPKIVSFKEVTNG